MNQNCLQKTSHVITTLKRFSVQDIVQDKDELAVGCIPKLRIAACVSVCVSVVT